MERCVGLSGWLAFSCEIRRVKGLYVGAALLVLAGCAVAPASPTAAPAAPAAPTLTAPIPTASLAPSNSPTTLPACGWKFHSRASNKNGAALSGAAPRGQIRRS